jgi:hypothetical protein
MRANNQTKENRMIIDTYKVTFKDGCWQELDVAEDDSIQDEIVDFCDFADISTDDVLNYSLIGIEEV